MHAEIKRVIDTGLWGVSSSLFAGVISPAGLQAWFQTIGAFGATIVTILSAINLLWIMAERFKDKQKD